MTKIAQNPHLRATGQAAASLPVSAGRESEPALEAAAAETDSFERVQASPFAPTAQQFRPGGAPLGLQPYTGHRRIPADVPGTHEAEPAQAPEALRQDASPVGREVLLPAEEEEMDRDALRSKPGASLERKPFARRDDKNFVLSVVRQLGMELAHASVRLRADPEVVKAAVESQGRAIQYASLELQQDKELALAAVRDDVQAWEELSPPICHDRDVLLEVNRLAGPSDSLLADLHDGIPPELAKDRDFQLQLLRQNAWAIEFVPADLLSDPTFAAEAAMAFPPLLDRPPLQQRKKELFAARAGLRERHKAVKDGARKLGIEDTMRLRSAELLDEVLRNRLEPVPGDRRPVAAVVYCKAETDHNGAMQQHNFDELSRHYRIRYYEVQGEAELAAALKDAGKDRPAALVAIGGHGSRETVQLGAAKGGKKATLDLEDEPSLQRMGLENFVDQDAPVVLMSCSTGAGGSERNNVANMMARLLPGRVVFAPTRPTMDQLKFDQRGLFVDPSYRGGAEETFRAWRLQLSPSE